MTPLEVASRCQDWPGLVFFDSALPAQGALSMISAHPTEVIVGGTEADWERLRRKIAALHVPNGAACGIPYGFAAGWVGYDGSFCFGIYDKLLAFLHGPGGGWYSLGGLHRDVPRATGRGTPAPGKNRLRFSPALPRKEFVGMVRRAQDYIAAGDIYQVNLAHCFSADWEPLRSRGVAPFAFYRALRRCSPAPYAAFLSLCGTNAISSSPELFLDISGPRIRTRPIKGTRPRRRDCHADACSAQELLNSPKENAELIMITDLERNDLGQICEFGSVSVCEMCKLEAYEQVFHLVSTVEGRLLQDVDAVTALRACFPGGSITGAPKKRAMEIIAELEPVPRGIYTGAIGYFGFNGSASRFARRSFKTIQRIFMSAPASSRIRRPNANGGRRSKKPGESCGPLCEYEQ